MILIEHGADVDAHQQQMDLHRSSGSGRVRSREDLVKLLIEHGADIHALNEDGNDCRRRRQGKRSPGRGCKAALGFGIVRTMFQVQRTPQVADVVVIGSGAGGGTAVKVLTDLGINVTLLEAGPMLNPFKDFKEHMLPYEVDHRGAGEKAELYYGQQQWGYFSAPNGYWHVPGEPYTTAPGNEFQWFRSRILGGRTNHYGRISLRFADYDFKPREFDGLGFDWPMTYEEMAPYYDKAEEFIGVTGSLEGLRSAPDGKFLPPIPPRVHEILVQKAGKKLGIPVIPSRMAMLTKSVHGRAALSLLRPSADPRLQDLASAFSSSQAMILPALKTGKLTIVTGAMARELVVDNSGAK